jgi:hypothetical protein
MFEGWWLRRRCSMTSPRSCESQNWDFLDGSLQARMGDMVMLVLEAESCCGISLSFLFFSLGQKLV